MDMVLCLIDPELLESDSFKLYFDPGSKQRTSDIRPTGNNMPVTAFNKCTNSQPFGWCYGTWIPHVSTTTSSARTIDSHVRTYYYQYYEEWK